MRLLLIRHGQTPANVLGRLDTARPGPGLTDLGETQAARIPSALADTDISAIYTSVLVRTHLTAAPLVSERRLEPHVLPGVHEIESGSLEGRTDRSALRAYLDTVFGWADGDRDLVMPGGSDGHEFFARFDADIAGLEAQSHGDRAVAVVSHGAAIRVWTAGRATNVPSGFAADNELANTGIVTLTGSTADGWTLESWGHHPAGGAILDDTAAVDPTGEGTGSAPGH